MSPQTHTVDDMTLNDLWDSGKALALAVWARTSRRMRMGAAFLVFL